jgi:uncharacterized protein
MTVAQALLDLQAIDTTADQLTHRRASLPVRESFATATERARAWERRRGELSSRLDELAAAIESAESRSATLLAQRERLEQQLRTVIAPREAEALMHEIATIDGQRDELDDDELAALEEQSALDDQLQAHLGEREEVAETVRLADAALAQETGDIDAELVSLDERRAAARAEVPADLLATYDRKRAALGVAVAPLVGKQCQGCFLELSAAEIDTVKQEAATTGVTDCPDCGRLLVVTVS